MRMNIQYYPHSDFNSLGTLNATFLALLHTQLTLYSTSDNQGCWETGRFTKAVWPPLPRQKIKNMPVFWCSPFNFCQICIVIKFDSPTILR